MGGEVAKREPDALPDVGQHEAPGQYKADYAERNPEQSLVRTISLDMDFH
jgi:hypothetical protein